MRDHMTDEGWQLFVGLESWQTRYKLIGHKVNKCIGSSIFNETDVQKILNLGFRVNTLLIQDKREWVGRTAGPGFNSAEAFRNVHLLKDRPDIFKLTVLKDAHSAADYDLHVGAAEEAGVHAWVVYYHPDLVKAQAPFVRPKHLVRTYHTVDADKVPAFVDGKHRHDAIVSGAVSRVYPLRQRLIRAINDHQLSAHWHRHPGYGRNGCHTPSYLETLSQFKVSVCTTSIYGYAVRKIIESTACGCRVITDLPVDDVLPEIEANLYRVDSSADVGTVNELIRFLSNSYDDDKQRALADAAKNYYDYRTMGRKLAADIEALRKEYNK